MQQSLIIKTTGLSYHYSKGEQVLTDINLSVEKGSIYGFIGPNGSGKTTTISLILGLLKKQQGHIEIFGQHIHSNRISILGRIGSLVETPSVYGHLTAKENLEVYRGIYGSSRERIAEVLGMVSLEDTGKKPVKRFSMGMKQRLSIALALLPGPELLVLDEPTNGLDPAGIIGLRQLIRTLNKAHGITIFISSHLLAEIEKIVSHIGIIYKGKMLFQGSLEALHLFKQQGSRLLVKTSDDVKAMALLQSYEPAMTDATLSLLFHDQQQVAQVNRLLTSHNLDVYLLHPKANDLEQLFINLTSN